MSNAKVSHEAAENAACPQMDGDDSALLGRYFEQQRALEAEHAEMVGLLDKLRDILIATDEEAEDRDEVDTCPRCYVFVQVEPDLEADPGDMCHPCCATAVSEARALLARIDGAGKATGSAEPR